MKPVVIRLSLQRPLQHRDSAMTPTITTAMTYSKEPQTLTHKLRKPLVERFRRERINSSIEQLKSLLGPEFLKQQPDSKLEKADILEMTVCLLKQLQQHQPTRLSSKSVSLNQGFSKCVKEMVCFLSKDEVKTQSHKRQQNPLQNLQTSDTYRSEANLAPLSSQVQPSLTKDKNQINSFLWRPW
ncbi:transcription factor HES-5-like [Lampris incognitus]|uniref:transcription factor HES-5-like n=1 Tax=Lampris incognitus TaxID=2546036 RepID=UPI0024B60CA4|nr:transcription factor HES-5-like [Lampris incognitus]